MKNIKTTKRPIRDRMADGIVSLMKPVYFLLKSKREPWKVKQEELACFTEGTLGRALHAFLTKNCLKMIPKAEFHDVFHVLFGYNTTMHDETCIQFVPLGNGAITAAMLASTFVSLLFYPENWGDYYRAFQRGRKANRFYDLDFEHLLQVPLVLLQEQIFAGEKEISIQGSFDSQAADY